jgi:hypothetical protein
VDVLGISGAASSATADGPPIAPSPRLRSRTISATRAVVSVLTRAPFPITFKLRRINGGWYIDG